MAAALAAAALTVLAAGLTSFAEEAADTFVTGTRINGIGVGGLDAEEARERIEGFYASEYTLSIEKKGGGRDQIRGSDIDYRVTVPQELSAILDAQNASGRASGPSVDNSHTLDMAETFSQEKLEAAIQALPCISGAGITVTSDPHISAYAEGEPFTIIPAVQGNNVDAEKTAALIKQAVQAGETSLNLEAEGCYYTVGVWETSPELTALCQAMNQLRQREIRYIFGGEQEVLSGEVMSSWITGSQGDAISLDQEKMTAYVTDLAARHDTAGTERAFTTVSGAEKLLTGPYGWKIDIAGETAALTQIIQGTAQTADLSMLKWPALALGLWLFLFVRRRLAARLWRKRLREGDANAAALWAYRLQRRLLPWGGREQPQVEELALKARFSQHTLTQAERERTAAAVEGERDRVDAALPWWKRLAFRWLFALR